MSASSEALRPDVAWNATHAAGALMVVIIAAIALAFWPSLEPSEPQPAAERQTHGLATPHQPIMVDGEACAQCQP